MTSSEANFKQNYQAHLKHLKFKGLQPKTIDAYSRLMRRIGAYFDHQINDLETTMIYTHDGLHPVLHTTGSSCRYDGHSKSGQWLNVIRNQIRFYPVNKVTH